MNTFQTLPGLATVNQPASRDGLHASRPTGCISIRPLWGPATVHEAELPTGKSRLLIRRGRRACQGQIAPTLQEVARSCIDAVWLEQVLRVVATLRC